MIIVTGGAGFIGSALVRELNGQGFMDIIVVDDLGHDNKWQNLVKAKFDNIISIAQFRPWLLEQKPKIEAIFHLGACSTTTETNADYLISNNTHYSMDLFRYCADHAIPFIYASSAATYGSEEHDFSDAAERIGLLRPINKYGYSKQLFDQWVLNQAKTPPLWAGLKFFNVYGANEYHKGGQASVAFHAFHQIRDRDTLKLFKSYRADVLDGYQKRDFVYIKDVLKVMTHFLQNKSKPISGIYNVGSGYAKTFFELGTELFKAMDKPTVNIEFIPMPDSLISQYQYFTKANLDRLRTVACYNEPMHLLSDGIKDYVQNYLLNKDFHY